MPQEEYHGYRMYYAIDKAVAKAQTMRDEVRGYMGTQRRSKLIIV